MIKMNKKEKRDASMLKGGIGANVVDGDLNLAIRIWKQELKDSGKLQKLKENSYYVKPAVERKNVKELAKYKNYKKNSK
jgi:ribosomal protein S21